MSEADYAAICESVASEWQLGGMDGLYSDFASEVAKRAVRAVLEELIRIDANLTGQQRDDAMSDLIVKASAALAKARGETT